MIHKLIAIVLSVWFVECVAMLLWFTCLFVYNVWGRFRIWRIDRG